ncbi:MAG TPA: PhnD/SsuA/transferrin family substrate-binding protein [Azospirillum sp.]|nr:PhnD/SsuA/transferrin family substrate-binding protein [Azospirillum sp.]
MRWILALCLCVWTAAAAAAPPVRVGVLAYRGGDHAIAVWEPTIRYLADRLPGRGAVMVPLDLAGIEAAVRERSIDFVLTNTGQYVDLEARHGITRIATLRSHRAGRDGGAIGSAILVRADDARLRTLADLDGRRLAAVDGDAFGGFQVAWGELLEAGVDPFRGGGTLFTGFPLDRVVLAVRDGAADAGIVRACLLEEMAAEGRIDAGSFRVLAPRSVPGFGCAVSTRLYPDWPFSRLADTPEDLAKAVVIALLEMPVDHPAAQAAGTAGWAVPLDYQPVHALFQTLGIGPYRNLRPASVIDLLRAHWHWLAIGGVGLLWWVVHVVRVEHLVKRRTAELRAANRDLQQEMAERRRAQEESRRRQIEMDHVARLSILGEMASNLAHELNQPLAAITNYARGCARRLDAGTADPAELVEATRAISAQAERAAQIIQRIRDFVRKRAPLVEPMDVNAAVLAARALCDSRARGAGVTLRLALADGLPPVAADRLQIEQVVLNLILNALDAMAEAAPADPTVTLTTHAGDGRVELAVADHGPGLAPHLRDRLFEPFFTTKPQGMGLGLSICRTIVEAHGGRLWAEDNPDGGLVMRVSLPASEKEAS